MRIKDLTYYPLMGESFCAFAIQTGTKQKPTYHQCDRYPRATIEGYGFCAKHIARIKRMIEAEETK